MALFGHAGREVSAVHSERVDFNSELRSTYEGEYDVRVKFCGGGQCRRGGQSREVAFSHKPRYCVRRKSSPASSVALTLLSSHLDQNFKDIRCRIPFAIAFSVLTLKTNIFLLIGTQSNINSNSSLRYHVIQPPYFNSRPSFGAGSQNVSA